SLKTSPWEASGTPSHQDINSLDETPRISRKHAEGDIFSPHPALPPPPGPSLS
ncbi:hypothetical protein KUCAC02_008725, partial [Chaenocephalus aceratus]